MKIIYIVTQGEYSEDSINAVFDSKELAESYVSSFKDHALNGICIEEHKLNPFKEQIEKGLKAYFIRIDRKGQTESIYHQSSCSLFESSEYKITYDKKFMNVHCFAKDEEHAVKIANERRIVMISNGEW